MPLGILSSFNVHKHTVGDVAYKLFSIACPRKGRNGGTSHCWDQIDSPYSNMVVYDMAGHHQYFSSHSACLEAISLVSPAIFLLLQDLRKDPEAMTKEVYYWSTMIDGVCHKSPQQSPVIVVGTHADLLTRVRLKEKMNLCSRLLRWLSQQMFSH